MTPLLEELFYAAVAAADPRQVLAPRLPPRPAGRLRIIGAGKAAAAMAAALESAWGTDLEGLVVTRYGHGAPTQGIEVVEAAHPVPDAAGERAAARMLALTADLGPEDTVVCLLSGGGSALLAQPAPGLSLADKQHLSRALLRSGAAIDELNCVRKHLSAIKGGRLALHCHPARVLTLAISDVPGDHPEVIASGPTVADPSTRTEALEILRHYGIETPAAIERWLADPAAETPKPGDPRLAANHFELVATPQQSLEAAAALARERGYHPLILSDRIEGEAREVAKVHAAIARQVVRYDQPVAQPCVLLSGGETTVTVRGSGRGGRNAEFLLALLCELRGAPGIEALAADTDGIDGSEDNAGCWMRPDTWTRARAAGIDLAHHLRNNDAYGAFRRLDALVISGPTRTNVNDFRAIVVGSPHPGTVNHPRANR